MNPDATAIERAGIVLKKCLQCDKEFNLKPSRPGQKYCSRKCFFVNRYTSVPTGICGLCSSADVAESHPTRCKDCVTKTYTRRPRLKEYSVWSAMKDRCSNPNNKMFKNYGGRGISVCERWKTSFEAFLEDMGPRPGSKLSIDRINNDGNYEPSNCKWSSWAEQQKNTRRNHLLTLNGETHTLTEWAKLLDVKRSNIRWRIRAGLPIEQVLSPEKLNTSFIEFKATHGKRING